LPSGSIEHADDRERKAGRDQRHDRRGTVEVLQADTAGLQRSGAECGQPVADEIDRKDVTGHGCGLLGNASFAKTDHEREQSGYSEPRKSERDGSDSGPIPNWRDR
jgi:hypothetical protein